MERQSVQFSAVAEGVGLAWKALRLAKLEVKRMETINQLKECGILISPSQNTVTLSQSFKQDFVENFLDLRAISLDTYIESLIDGGFFKQPKSAKEVSDAISVLKQFVNEKRFRKEMKEAV